MGRHPTPSLGAGGDETGRNVGPPIAPQTSSGTNRSIGVEMSQSEREPRRYQVLVLGFGPFGGVIDNPAGRLALGLNGSKLPGGGRIVGEMMEVTWAAAHDHPLRRARALDAPLVLGIGVARGRKDASIERFGRRLVSPDLADVRGVRISALSETGKDELECATASRWADALGVSVSDDAGRYVCNGWVWYAMHEALPAAFLHVPDEGFPLARLRQGIRTMARSWLATRESRS